MSVKQEEAIVKYIAEYYQRTKFYPNFREIAEGVNLFSISTIYHHMKILESKGIIIRKVDCSSQYRIKDIEKYLDDQANKAIGTPAEFRKLAEYRDLEDQGKLLKLPCKVDSEIWYVDKYADLYTEIVRGVVDGFLWYRSCGFALNVVWDKPIMGHFGYKRKEMPFYEIGKTVFLTQEEANATLTNTGKDEK